MNGIKLVKSLILLLLFSSMVSCSTTGFPGGAKLTPRTTTLCKVCEIQKKVDGKIIKGVYDREKGEMVVPFGEKFYYSIRKHPYNVLVSVPGKIIYTVENGKVLEPYKVYETPLKKNLPFYRPIVRRKAGADGNMISYMNMLFYSAGTKKYKVVSMEGKLLVPELTFSEKELEKGRAKRFVAFPPGEDTFFSMITGDGRIIGHSGSDVTGLLLSPIDGFIISRHKVGQKELWGLMNIDGTLLVDPKYTEIEVLRAGRAKRDVFLLTSNDGYEIWGEYYSDFQNFGNGKTKDQAIANAAPVFNGIDASNDKRSREWMANLHTRKVKKAEIDSWKKKAEDKELSKKSIYELWKMKKQCVWAKAPKTSCDKFQVAIDAKNSGGGSSGSYAGKNGGVNYNKAQFSISNQHSISRMKANTRRLRGR